MFRFRLASDYFIHWISSNSRHGTHSPFVYRLVDEVIYNYRAQTKSQLAVNPSRKVNGLINRLIDFFKPKDFRMLLSVADLEDVNELSFLLITKEPLALFQACLPKADSQTVLVFQDIYANKDRKAAWKKIKENPQVSVTVDLFYIGLVFFRTGQAKEDFKIRF
ncbi:MAG: hypothetical protein ACKOW2_02275 [Sphingobacteriaceae bacterium]